MLLIPVKKKDYAVDANEVESNDVLNNEQKSSKSTKIRRKRIVLLNSESDKELVRKLNKYLFFYFFNDIVMHLFYIFLFPELR